MITHAHTKHMLTHARTHKEPTSGVKKLAQLLRKFPEVTDELAVIFPWVLCDALQHLLSGH